MIGEMNMILHKSQSDFKELLELTSEYFNLDASIVEKDYWVTKSLHNLSVSEARGVAIFKGGTSLTKCYKDLHRFSEDIDIAIDIKGLTGGQIKRRLKAVEKAMRGNLVEVEDPEFTDKKGIVRRTQYNYDTCLESVVGLSEMHPHIRFEIVGFTEPTPIEVCETKSMIYDYLIDNELPEVIEQFGLGLFTLNVLRIDRTILEKMASLIRMSYKDGWDELSRKTRHLYDIFFTFDELKDFYSNSDEFQALVKIVKAAELNHNFAKEYPSQAKWTESPLLEALESNVVKNGYEQYFGKEFVFGVLPPFEEIKAVMTRLFTLFADNDL